MDENKEIAQISSKKSFNNVRLIFFQRYPFGFQDPTNIVDTLNFMMLKGKI